MARDKEYETFLVIADISGYTEFMLKTQRIAGHTQVIISELLTAVLKKARVPLVLAKIEGDAVFLYCRKENEKSWQKNRQMLAEKLFTFTATFREKIRELEATDICKCAACAAISLLKLKVVVHYGTAFFHRLAGRDELAGVDVITAHRMLKNSVGESEYVMISQAAFEQLSLSRDQFAVHNETYDTGDLVTFVQVPRYHALSPISFSRQLVVRNQVIKNTKSVWHGVFGSRYFTPKNTSFRRTFWSRLGIIFFLPFFPLLFLRDVIAGLFADLKK